MRQKRLLIAIALAASAFVFLLTIADFLALHDISKDYVSFEILEHLDITLSQDLPDWTATKGEWEIVRVSYVSRFLFFIFVIVVLSLCLKQTKDT